VGLRIALLSKNFSVTGGGAERYSMALVEHMATRHEMHVFSQTIGHRIPGVTYRQISCPMDRPRWINQLWFAGVTWWATRRGFDIVHSHENTWHGNVQTVHVLPVKHNLFAHKSGFALAICWLKVFASPRLVSYLWLEKMRYRPLAGRQIVLASSTLRDFMMKSYPGAVHAMRVIAPGVESAPGACTPEMQGQARGTLGLPQAGRCVLLVGNDLRKKGLPALVAALALLPADVWVAVVGKGKPDGPLAEDILTAGVQGRVHFLGPQQDMRMAYRAADCLVHPTLEDTYAMVVLEAMAHGLPVIVSGKSYCGIAAELQNGVNAKVLANPRDPAELARNLGNLLANPLQAEELASAGLEFAKARTWFGAAQAYEDTYADALRVNGN
jgi:glycosyltransferase involved in cell wall biosynthesis